MLNTVEVPPSLSSTTQKLNEAKEYVNVGLCRQLSQANTRESVETVLNDLIWTKSSDERTTTTIMEGGQPWGQLVGRTRRPQLRQALLALPESRTFLVKKLVSILGIQEACDNFMLLPCGKQKGAVGYACVVCKDCRQTFLVSGSKPILSDQRFRCRKFILTNDDVHTEAFGDGVTSNVVCSKAFYPLKIAESGEIVSPIQTAFDERYDPARCRNEIIPPTSSAAENEEDEEHRGLLLLSVVPANDAATGTTTLTTGRGDRVHEASGAPVVCDLATTSATASTSGTSPASSSKRPASECALLVDRGDVIRTKVAKVARDITGSDRFGKFLNDRFDVEILQRDVYPLMTQSNAFMLVYTGCDKWFAKKGLMTVSNTDVSIYLRRWLADQQRNGDINGGDDSLDHQVLRKCVMTQASVFVNSVEDGILLSDTCSHNLNNDLDFLFGK